MKSFLFALAASVFAWSPLQAQLNIYLELELDGQDVEGEPITQTVGPDDVSNLIECFAFNHEVFTPLNASTGLPTGRRTHKPVTITKRVDKASPALYQGLFNNSSGEATFKFYRRAADEGQIVHIQTITLTNVRVVQVRRWQPSTLDPAGATQPLMEEVSFVYQQITIEDEGSQASASDDQDSR